MSSIAKPEAPLLSLFAPAFTAATFARAQLLGVAAILTSGRRTVANLLRTVADLTEGDSSCYHRVLSLAHWSGLTLAALLTRFIIRHFWPHGRIRLAGDDTVTEHPGRKVHGKARHRDAVRSSQSYTAWRWGHKWVVLAILVQFPFARRPWALPVLVTLYRSPQDNQQRGRPHQTPAQLLQLLLRLLLRWFPDRQFVFAGDSGYGSHEVASLAHHSQGRLVVVSKFPADANLYEAPPPYAGKGRPRVKGQKLSAPQEVVAKAERTRLNVAWYGGGRRDVEVVSGVGHWYRAGQGLVEVRWVYVHDLTGTHRDEYFYSTDVAMPPQEIIEEYTGRWNIETTFEDARAYLGLESTRGWCERTVGRAEPCLLGLYSVVALMYWLLPGEDQDQGCVEWEGKQGVTFSDAITAVRRWLWTHWVFPRAGHADAFAKLPQAFQQLLLYALAPAA
jgi:DDE superfamily endonuclease